MSYSQNLHFSVVEEPVGFTVILDGGYNPADRENIPYQIIETNIGNGYISNRNEFICPHAGHYVFYVALYANDNAICWLDIMKNGEQTNTAHSNHNGYNTGTTMVVLDLAAGDIVSAVNIGTGCQLFGDRKINSFSGFRIY